MEKLFEIATNVSTPLALSGLIATICLFAIKIIISKNIFPELTKQLSAVIIKSIINNLFMLAYISLLLGFLGWIISKVIDNDINNGNSIYTIEGTVFFDNKECEDVTVKILEIEKTDKTNYFGKFNILIDKNAWNNYDNLTFKFYMEKLKIDTVITRKKGEYLKYLKFMLLTPTFNSEELNIDSTNDFSTKIKKAENYFKAGSAFGRNKAIEIYHDISINLSNYQREKLKNTKLLKDADMDYINQRYDNALIKYHQVFSSSIENN